jgi:hypothetical protein
VIRALLRFVRLLPARLELEHLRWARREMDPLHSQLPYVVRRINQLERVCHG